MALMNRKGEIVFVTQSVKGILGFDTRELVGKSGFDLLFRYSKPKARCQYESIIQQPNLYLRAKLWIRHKFCRGVRAEVTLRNLLNIPSIGGVLVILRVF